MKWGNGWYLNSVSLCPVNVEGLNHISLWQVTSLTQITPVEIYNMLYASMSYHRLIVIYHIDTYINHQHSSIQFKTLTQLLCKRANFFILTVICKLLFNKGLVMLFLKGELSCVNKTWQILHTQYTNIIECVQNCQK